MLALGNGAPDIASIVAGMFTGSAGFGLGEPIGGGLLVTSVVLGLVVLSADMNVAPVPFFRDVCAYLIANIFVLTTILVFGYFDFITAMICLGIYLAYVIIVILTQSLGSILHKLSRPLRHWLQVKFPNGIVNRLVKKPKKNQPAPVYGHLDAELSSDEDKDDVTTFGWFGFKSTGKKGAHKTFVDMVVDEAKADTTMYMFPKMGLLLKKKADERKKKRAEREALENDADINNPNQSFVHAMEDKTPIIHDHFSLENFENQEQRKVAENAALVSISASSENGINSPAPKNMKENSKTVDSSDSSSSDDSDDEGNAVGEIGSSSLTETGESKIKEFRTLDDAKKEAKERQEAQKKAYFEKVEERSYFERWLIWIGWHDMSLFEKFLYPIMGPTIFLRNLTIPKADPEEYSRFFSFLDQKSIIFTQFFIGFFDLFWKKKALLCVKSNIYSIVVDSWPPIHWSLHWAIATSWNCFTNWCVFLSRCSFHNEERQTTILPLHFRYFFVFHGNYMVCIFYFSFFFPKISKKTKYLILFFNFFKKFQDLSDCQ